MRKTLSALLFGATLLLTSPTNAGSFGPDLMPVTWRPGITRVEILEATEDLEPRIIKMGGSIHNPSFGCLMVPSPHIRYQVNLQPGERPIDACDYLKTVGAGPEILSECDYAIRKPGSEILTPFNPLCEGMTLTVDYAPCPPNPEVAPMTTIEGMVLNEIKITPNYTTFQIMGKIYPKKTVTSFDDFFNSGGVYEVKEEEQWAYWNIQLEGNAPISEYDKVIVIGPTGGLPRDGDITQYDHLLVRDKKGRDKFSYYPTTKKEDTARPDRQFGEPAL